MSEALKVYILKQGNLFTDHLKTRKSSIDNTVVYSRQRDLLL